MRLLMLTLGITLLVALASPAGASDTESARATLKGLRGVQVLVEHFNEDNKRAGYDSRTFQTDVELKLRMAGIKVLTRDEHYTVPGWPYLYLNVKSLAERPGEVAAAGVHLGLNQAVRLTRKLSVEVDAETWSTGVVIQGDLPYVRDAVKDYVDKFINAWLSVNMGSEEERLIFGAPSDEK